MAGGVRGKWTAVERLVSRENRAKGRLREKKQRAPA